MDLFKDIVFEHLHSCGAKLQAWAFFANHCKLDKFVELCPDHPPPAIDPAVWDKDWGVHLQPFGDGKRAIQYLGAYVFRTAIGDSRILAIGHASYKVAT